MLRLPRTNPRPQGLHQNPSGLAVALGFTALGAVGGVGYLLYKVKAAAQKRQQELMEALRQAYVIPSEVGLLPIRFLPDGGVQLLDVSPDKDKPNEYCTMAHSTVAPNPSDKGKVFADFIKSIATAPTEAEAAVQIEDCVYPFGNREMPPAGKLKFKVVTPSRLKEALERLSGESKTDVQFVFDRLMNDRIIKTKAAKRQKKFAEATSTQNKAKK